MKMSMVLKMKAAAVVLILSIGVQASSIIDELDNLTNVGNDSASCIFAIADSRLSITCNGGYWGQALAGWNIGGPNAYNCNFSLKPADGQTIFGIKGIIPITPAGKTQADLWITVFSSDTGTPNSGRPVGRLDIPAGAIDFTFDMTTLLGKTGFWSVEIVVDTFSQTKTGFSFDAFSAVPEPATLGLMALGGLGLLKKRTSR